MHHTSESTVAERFLARDCALGTHIHSADASIQVSNGQTIPASVYYSISEGKRFVAAGFYKVDAKTSPTLSAYEQFVAGMEASLKANGNLESLKFDRDLSIEDIRGKQYELR